MPLTLKEAETIVDAALANNKPFCDGTHTSINLKD
jgi:CDGSH-type Zn-finger protein